MKYEIVGGNMPAALVRLEPGEGVYCEGGAMSWMDDGIEMKTEAGGLGKMLGRAFSGESLFRNHYVANRAGEIAFGSNFPGEIRAVELTPGQVLIAQKGAYLASDEGIEMSVHFQKKIAGGFFGGEGFIMNKFTGTGTVLLEIDGSAVEYDLAPGQKKVIETGTLVMMDGTCDFDIQMIKGVKNMLFGGEGLFNTIVTGPGKILVQTLPISTVAANIASLIPGK